MEKEEQFEQSVAVNESEETQAPKRQRRKIRRTVFGIGYAILMINATFFAADGQAPVIYGLCIAFAAMWAVDEFTRYRASKQNQNLISAAMGLAAGLFALAVMILR